MIIELTKDEYLQTLDCLNRDIAKARVNGDVSVELYDVTTNEVILQHFYPRQDPGYNLTNEEDTFYQLKVISKEMSRDPIPKQQIQVKSWKDLQLVLDLAKEDADKNEES